MLVDQSSRGSFEVLDHGVPRQAELHLDRESFRRVSRMIPSPRCLVVAVVWVTLFELDRRLEHRQRALHVLLRRDAQREEMPRFLPGWIESDCFARPVECLGYLPLFEQVVRERVLIRRIVRTQRSGVAEMLERLRVSLDATIGVRICARESFTAQRLPI